MSSEPTTEDTLVRQAVAGDRAAAQILFMRHYDMLTDFLIGQLSGDLRGAVNVDDIVQQAFAKAYESIPRYTQQHENAFGACLRTIALNTLRDRLRQMNREQAKKARRPADAALDPEATFLILLNRIGDDAGIPADEAMRHEAVQALQAAIANLPDDYQDAIRYRYLEDRPLDEVAELMDRSPGAIRALCNRAKEQLRQELGRLSRFI